MIIYYLTAKNKNNNVNILWIMSNALKKELPQGIGGSP